MRFLSNIPFVVLSILRVSLGYRFELEGRKLAANLVGTLSVNDSQDIQYTVNITLGGAPFVVQIDTGSSDLWVATDDAEAFNETEATAEVDYAVGSASGPIATGDLEFAGFTVKQQAFILVTPSDDQPAGQGLIGLGPSSGSQVLAAFDLTAAAPPLDRIFEQDTSTPNYVTIKLGREEDPSVPYPGDLTIGEVLADYQNITSQKKLAVSVVSIDDSPNQHWQTLLDPNGIIGPDGKAISTPSVAALNFGSSASDQLAVVFDTGFTIPQVPKYVSDAIYENVKGAQFVNITGLGPAWALPCDQEVDISFVFGGQTIPIHPLDTNFDGLNITDDNGDQTCIGIFQPISEDAEGDTYDMILGMGFLRNIYLLIDFGDFIDGSTTSLGDPYMQMLSTTNPSTAHTEFVNMRSGSTPVAPHTSSSSHGINVGLIAGTVGGVVGFNLLVAAAMLFIRARKRSRAVAVPIAQTVPYNLVQTPGSLQKEDAYPMSMTPNQAPMAYNQGYTQYGGQGNYFGAPEVQNTFYPSR